MYIREYVSADCDKLAELFYQTVHTVNAKDYTEEQLNVWATGNVNLQDWDQSFLKLKLIEMEIEIYKKIQNCCNINDNTRWIYGNRWDFGYDSRIDVWNR